MKRIYIFTLEGEDYPSKKFNNNLRLFVYMLYMEIYNYDGENNVPLDIHPNIKYNNLLDDTYERKYVFDSDMNPDKTIDYEPFIIDEDTCGLTIIDDSFDYELISNLAHYILKMLNYDTKYKVTIRYVDYDAKNLFDEVNRETAMITVLKMLGYEDVKKSGFVRRLINKVCNVRR